MRFQTQHLLVPLGQAFDAVAYFDHGEVPRSYEVAEFVLFRAGSV